MKVVVSIRMIESPGHQVTLADEVIDISCAGGKRIRARAPEAARHVADILKAHDARPYKSGHISTD